MRAPSYHVLDDALDDLAGFGPELRNGNFNHAPMVLEALCALGRPEVAMPWIENYRNRLVPRAPAREAFRCEEWRAALGRRERFPDWSAFLAGEIDAAPWRDVLERWAGRLAPGFSAAATHGVIRVGHAVRALAQLETSVRRRELADALASWAAAYSELPAAPTAALGRMSPREAIGTVAIVPMDRRRPGNITAALDRLVEFPEFAPATWLIALDGDLDPLIADLSEVFARVYLANTHSVLTAIVFVHGVTSLHALANIAPYVEDQTARSLARYAWQAGCGLYACFGGGTAMADVIGPGDDNCDGLIDLALANGDEHVIKFTEACLSRHATHPSPAYPAAVRHVIGAIRGR